MSVRILQLSDPHLLSDPDAQLRGVPTYRSLRQVLRHLDREASGFDWVILTGDLAHDEQRETYRLLRRTLAERSTPWRMIPGNHDCRAFMREVFPELSGPGRDFFGFCLDLPGWKLVGLDSRLPGSVSGRVGRPQLDWLKRELQADPGKPTILFIHYPPVPVGCPWMDRIGLEDAEHLGPVVGASPQVQLVLCGHVHHEFRGRVGEAAVLAAPSTAFQFLPQGEIPVFNPAPPGARILELDGSRWRTRVVRVPELIWVPNRDA